MKATAEQLAQVGVLFDAITEALPCTDISPALMLAVSNLVEQLQSSQWVTAVRDQPRCVNPQVIQALLLKFEWLLSQEPAFLEALAAFRSSFYIPNANANNANATTTTTTTTNVNTTDGVVFVRPIALPDTVIKFSPEIADRLWRWVALLFILGRPGILSLSLKQYQLSNAMKCASIMITNNQYNNIDVCNLL